MRTSLVAAAVAACLVGSALTTVAPPRHHDESLFFDRSVPEYETVLTPSDFEMGMQMSEVLQFGDSDIWDSDAMYAKDRFEGDIVNDNLNASTVELFLNGAPINSNKNLNAIRNKHQLWPSGRIPYAISSQYSSYSRSLIASSMQEYATHTCVQWVPKANSDTNYVYIMPDRGCYSMVGGKQTLSLGSGCIQKGIIIHELMHAVGFFHEQSRTDRDNYITILWNNIQPGMQGQFEKYGQGTIQTLGSEYDYGSIMHYGSRAFSRNGQPTIVPKKQATIGQRSGFSKVDSYKINKLYGCPTGPTPPGVTPTTGSTTEAPTTQSTTTPTTTTQTTTARPTQPPQPTVKPTSVLPPSPSPSTPPPNSECKNTRHDCQQLADQGWCRRNPGWMKTYCAPACGMCEKSKPVTPTTVTTAPPTSSCEDLRVDCTTLVQQRYCKTSQNFMKTYCARSCGFCFAPPVTEIPDTTPISPDPRPTLVTQAPFVTFRPSPTATRSAQTTTTPSPATQPPPPPEPTAPGGPVEPPTPHPCRDRKHFCNHWKNAGFCEGIFMNYMKKNCPQSCGMC